MDSTDEQDEQNNLFALLQSDPTSSQPLDVLLDAIDANPAAGVAVTDATGASMPSLSSFFTDAVNAPANTSLNISSLLAASQQLAAPEPGTSKGSSTSSTRPVARPTWDPTTSDVLAGFQSVPTSLNFDVGFIPTTMDDIIRQQQAVVSQATAGPSSFVSAQAKSDPTFDVLSEKQLGKRPWTGDVEDVEKHEQIKRSIEANAVAAGMTTVLCLHASVAQKSYGNEKRLLSPAPMVRITGPLQFISPAPQLVMSINTEDGVQHAQESSNDDAFHRAYFRSLHVGGTGKAKSFSLSLSMHSPNPQQPPTATKDVVLPPPFATFDSAAVSIISKPSKKTAKARNTTSCLFAGSTISLINRINSQNARTKYMSIDDGKLAARTSAWSAVSVHVLRRAEDTDPSLTNTLANSKVPNASQTVTYGSEILLTDLMTGVSSERLIVRKVEKGKVILDACGPVSQLQKLALMRPSATSGEELYLSSADSGEDAEGNAVSWGGKTEWKPAAAKRRKKEQTPESGGQEDDDSTKPFLVYQPPTNSVTAEENEGHPAHVVSDYLQWTVIGITSFSYTFFDAYGGRDSQIPTSPITPFPTVCAPPVYQKLSHTVSLTVANFFHTAPDATEPAPIQVWLGSIGPLKLQKMHKLPNSGADIAVVLPSYAAMVQAARKKDNPEPTYDDLISSPKANDTDLTSVESDASKALNRSFAALTESIGSTTTSPILDSLPVLEPITTATTTTTAAAAAASFASDIIPPFATESTPILTSTTTSRPIQPLPSRTTLPLTNTDEPVPILPISIPQDASLPLIFIRPSDGIGFMTGRWLVAEQVTPPPTTTTTPSVSAPSYTAVLQGATTLGEQWHSTNGGGAKAWQIKIV